MGEERGKWGRKGEKGGGWGKIGRGCSKGNLKKGFQTTVLFRQFFNHVKALSK